MPVTAENPDKGKRGLYSIKDPFIEFWFKFVYPQRSLIETGRTEAVEARIKEQFVERHVSYIYEELCRENVREMSAQGAFSCAFERVGAWWERGEEIDVCAVDKESRTILFGECKYRSSKMDVDVFYALKRKATLVDWKRGNRNEMFALFSISGFTDALRRLAKTEDIHLLE
jgi:AAA+ ATPase superfamily predicted ATPase